LKSGSTHPERLARPLVGRGRPKGGGVDGDGGRAIFVGYNRHLVGGDAGALMCGRPLPRGGRPPGDADVGDGVSNIRPRAVVRCAVGDKYVMEEMLNRGLSLGGEQSGHIIFSDYLFTGDGLCTALNVLRTVALTGRTLADLASDLTTYPQVLLNVRVREKIEL